MGKFMDFFQKKIVPVLVKIGNEKHLLAIRNGLVVTIPFIIVGSFFLILGNLPFSWWASYIGKLGPMMNTVVTCSFGMLGLLASLGIGYNLAKGYDLDPITGAVMSLVAFLITQVTGTLTLDTSNFGSAGLFTAILVSIISVEILRACVKRGFVIKLPDGVPPAVANSFVSLIPGAIVILLIWVVRVVLGFNITSFLTLIFSPIVFALNTLPGILVMVLACSLLWCAGIHGDMIIYQSIATPIVLQYLSANSAAFMAHKPIPYITAFGFYDFFVCVGGTGATISLVMLMLRSKSKLYRSVGKVAFPSACFEINEPVVFGFPIVLNPMILLPYIVTPLVLATGTYLLMYFNIIGRPVLMLPWTMPPIIGPFLSTGGDWRAAVWSAVSLVIAAVIYYPSFKACEKQQLLNEKSDPAATEGLPA